MRPVLVFDGDCGVCTRLAGLVPRLRADVDVQPWQALDLAPLGLTPQACDEALQLVDERGRAWSAQDAVARLLRRSAFPLPLAGAVLQLPGVRALAGAGYRWVARNRHRLPGGTAACVLPRS
ncbi:thiol-disulfide oxidoreductase DCC family protein [Kineococcus sp. SYSU DK006]|uniref:thiol-disulfide oxidoreductase DCC family protein n=1 Tax=Kineococcus sp. SYSU DK006 TaxID=3383127 RepID=UPI003D7C8C18